MSERPLLIKNGRIPDRKGGKWTAADLLISGGKIVDIGDIPSKKSYTVYDARGNVIFPAFTDLRTNIYPPPYIRTEKIATTLSAAMYGGFSRLCASPMQTVDAALIETLSQEGERLGCEILAVGSPIKSNGEPSDIDRLFELGTIAIGHDGAADNEVFYRAACRVAANDRLMIVHANDRRLAGRLDQSFNAYKNGGEFAALPENIATADAITIAAASGCRMHITGVSTAYAAKLVREAKKSGLPITADTCPQYFSMTSDDLIFYGSNVKLSHPLRSERDRRAIAEAIADGTIDAISTDHKALTTSEKSTAFERVPCGMLGLQTAFSVSLSSLVLSGVIDLYRLCELLSFRPAEIIGANGNIEIGAPAKLAVCDVDAEYLFDDAQLKTGRFVKNSPYLGQVLTGKVVKVF